MDIVNEIMNLKMTYETTDKKNKVIRELKKCKRSDPIFSLYFRFDIPNYMIFHSIWCYFCGERCNITMDGATCDRHGYIIIDNLNSLHNDSFMLGYYESCGLTSMIFDTYDF